MIAARRLFLGEVVAAGATDGVEAGADEVSEAEAVASRCESNP